MPPYVPVKRIAGLTPCQLRANARDLAIAEMAIAGEGKIGILDLQEAFGVSDGTISKALHAHGVNLVTLRGIAGRKRRELENRKRK